MSGAMVTALQRQIKTCRRQLAVLAESAALQSPKQYYIQRRMALEHLKNRLVSVQLQGISGRKQRYIGLTAKLDAMSPLKVLSRGFAMVQTEDGTLVQSVNQVNSGQMLSITVSDGTIYAAVTEKRSVPNESEENEL